MSPASLPHHRSSLQPHVPLLGLGVHGMSQGIVGIILKSHPGRRVPLGMLLAEPLLGVGAKSQLLALSQLDNEDVCGEGACWSLASPPGHGVVPGD